MSETKERDKGVEPISQPWENCEVSDFRHFSLAKSYRSPENDPESYRKSYRTTGFRTMSRLYEMTPEFRGRHTRWRKWYKGIPYFVNCTELGLPEDQWTARASYQHANGW